MTIETPGEVVNGPGEAFNGPAAASSDSAAALAQQIERAVVAADGTLVAGQSSGATSATKLSVGTYQVCFNVPITNGTYVASIGIPGNVGTSAPGEITVVGRFNTNNCLFIRTFNSAGALEDRGFHVHVAH
ncbi:hypothetical protein [Streptomyces roseifaciens]|uniref:hypothetical protein n=1 Tax=Streptomyces roseifaciens TaxID=1488406 RepID=UPI0007181709|nr:hypothetical protein [Streptomyces roseifaciens]